MSMGWSVFADGLHRQRLQQEIADGLAAMVWMYYENYTDATHLEPEVLRAMALLTDECMSGVDVEELVREVERKLNEEEGGIEGSDGKRHKVCTFEEEQT